MTEITVHFADADKSVPAQLGDNLLALAERHGIELDHACGGVCACSTCHVKITAGAECFSAASEDEEDQLDEARGVDLQSRLGCQATLVRAPADGTRIEVRIPTWNVNLVREGGH